MTCENLSKVDLLHGGVTVPLNHVGCGAGSSLLTNREPVLLLSRIVIGF